MMKKKLIKYKKIINKKEKNGAEGIINHQDIKYQLYLKGLCMQNKYQKIIKKKK